MLELRGISKSFPGVRALTGVQLLLSRGEIHGLVGENGAGKSTLMKIIAGVLAPDQGQVLLEGASVAFRSCREAIQRGVCMVHQEIQVVPESSLAENVMLDKLRTRNRLGVLDWPAIHREAQKYIDMVGLQVAPETPARGLSAAQKQLLQIAKALASRARLLLLDEPTSSLTHYEAAELHRILRRLQTDGVTILYVSHKLDEVFDLCQRVTVMRDGQVVATRKLSAVTRPELVRMMIGRDSAEERFSPLPSRSGPEALRVEGLSRRGKARDISFSLQPGEILGWYGLIGAGRTETARLIIGHEAPERGTIFVNGEQARIKSVRQALEQYRIGYVTENRKEEGLLLDAPVAPNITITIWPRLRNFLTRKINSRKEAQIADALVNRLGIKCAGLDQKTETLSGGNQQKVCLAKWLAADCNILIVDEPTVGVDVGAKEQLHRLIRDLAAKQGKAIILISSDLPEMLKLAGRILVFKDQRIVGEIRNVDAPGPGCRELSEAIGQFIT